MAHIINNEIIHKSLEYNGSFIASFEEDEEKMFNSKLDVSREGSNYSIKESQMSIISKPELEYNLITIEDEEYLGFWDNIKKNFSDVKNKIKYNFIQLENLIKLEDFTECIFFAKKYFNDKYIFNKNLKGMSFSDLKNDIIWFCYRNNFQSVMNGKLFYTSDAGWGCMIRVGQMILAKAIIEYKKIYNKNNIYYNTIILFSDNAIPYCQIKDDANFAYLIKKKQKEKELIKQNSEKSKGLLKRFGNKKSENDIDQYSRKKINEGYSISTENEFFIKENYMDKTIDKTEEQKINCIYPQNIHKKKNKINTKCEKKEMGNQMFLFDELDDVNNIIRRDRPSEKKGKHDKDNNNSEKISKDLDEKSDGHQKYITPPFSIKNICDFSYKYSKGAGMWFSNNMIINILKDINDELNPIENLKISNFESCIKTTEIMKYYEKKVCKCKKDVHYIESFSDSSKEIDGFVMIEDEEIKSKSITINCKCFNDKQILIEYQNEFYFLKSSFIIFLSLRLGLNALEPSYYNAVLELFDLNHNIGVIGGKGTKALYFIGKFEKNLVYLDPHYVKECDNNLMMINKNISEYKPSKFFSLKVEDCTPSLTLGLLCTGKNDFFQILKKIENSKYLKDIIKINH